MAEQLTLFDATEAALARAEAIERSGRNAHPAWRAAAREAVRWCANRYLLFTSDEVIARLDATGAPPTHNLAALGPVFLEAARAGEIAKTGHQRSTRIARRHRDLTVWRVVHPQEP